MLRPYTAFVVFSIKIEASVHITVADDSSVMFQRRSIAAG
jgi:hypothetical protein